MWTYLPVWLVQDGQVDELEVGSAIRQTGLAANFESADVAGTTGPEGVALMFDASLKSVEARTFLYEVRGVCGSARPIHADHGGAMQRVGSEFELRIGALSVVARTHTVFEPTSGSLVTGRCSFEVLADYEFDAFDLPEVRADWSVAALKVEYRALEPHDVVGADGRRHVEFVTGPVVDLINITRMRRWEDEKRKPMGNDKPRTSASYVLDLQPV